MTLAVLDTSVVISALSSTDRLHAVCTAALRSLRATGHEFRLPASAYAEVLVGVERGYHHRAGLEAFVTDIAPVVVVDSHVARAAAVARAGSPSLRLPDALVIGAGVALGAASVLTTDAAWRRIGPLVRVLG
jgi:predicted nucleic acid-binding protein